MSRILFAAVLIIPIALAAVKSAADDEAPASVRPVKSTFGADESIEVTVTNISADPVYLIPNFAAYPYDYFYPPDNYLERYDGGYWHPVLLVRDIAYYDKRLLFFELAPGDTHTLKCFLPELIDDEATKAGGEFRAAVTVIVNSESPVVSWKDFEKYGQGKQVTARSEKFRIESEKEGK